MKVLLLGSGGLSIGQAGEFDYSGSQAVKALREEGIEVIVVNPNIATVQTDPKDGVKIYLYPVEAHWVTKVIEQERPDGIVAGFGGQTALNCLLELDSQGVLEKFEVKNLGTDPKNIRASEDRQKFADIMRELEMPVLPSKSVNSLEDGISAARDIGYPVIVRAGYCLGGLASGFADNDVELEKLVTNALHYSSHALIEKSLKGWKELEYEIMRDSYNNALAVCNMENIDPLGVHTGDSIVVAPSQTLSNSEFQMLRDSALKIARRLEILGECNVQFALDPKSRDYFVIEVNARLSRSSALASKATGYPIAYIAAKAVLGHSLLDLKNPVTGTTSAFFEPALDYVTVKIPKWDLRKFPRVSRTLGSSMKSVGEVMGIGRNFAEAFQKAVRMVTEDDLGICRPFSGDVPVSLHEEISTPTDQRIFMLFECFRREINTEKIYTSTYIDKWFLREFAQLCEVEKEIQSSRLEFLSKEQLLKFKRFGFSDTQIAHLMNINKGEAVVRSWREKLGVKPSVKKIDTTAGEHPSPSQYLYVTYDGQETEVAIEKPGKSAIVLGCGAYRIGTSVEFDWCAVTCAEELRKNKYRSIIINCNPETVSTDYSSSDALYFEELSVERILDIGEFENCSNVIVSMGGQLPNKIAQPLANRGFKLLGHDAQTIEKAENRETFSKILDELGIQQPAWTSATNQDEVKSFIEKVGFPILVRPSFVLSGTSMGVAHSKEILDEYLTQACDISPDHPVVLSQFISGAQEIEVDGVSQNGKVLINIISEHIENAGVHSGDATIITPSQNLANETIEALKTATGKISGALKLNGPFNIQYLVRGDDIMVIECNARASRTSPFVSKVHSLNLAQLSTKVSIGKTGLKPKPVPPKVVGVKAAQFSFGRLAGTDPILGVEMVSTGEVGCLSETADEALLLALESSGIKTPKKGILLSAGQIHEKRQFLKVASVFKLLNLPLFATPGTSAFLTENGITNSLVPFPGQGENDALSIISQGNVDLVVNIPKNFLRKELTFGSEIRTLAIKHGLSVITDAHKAISYLSALVSRLSNGEQKLVYLSSSQGNNLEPSKSNITKSEIPNLIHD